MASYLVQVLPASFSCFHGGSVGIGYGGAAHFEALESQSTRMIGLSETLPVASTILATPDALVHASVRYQLMRNFVLRMTGFPVELIEGMAGSRSAQLTDEARETGVQVRAACERVLNSKLQFSRILRRKLKRGDAGAVDPGEDAPVEVRIVLEQFAEHAAMAECAEKVYAEDLEHARRLLYEFVRSDRFQEVLLVSSPELRAFTPASVDPPATRNSHIRQREMTWMSYLQRLTTKNETISFYGPCAWGEFDPSQRAAAVIEIEPQFTDERRVYFERWACEAIAARILDDEEAKLLLGLRLADDLLIHSAGAMLLQTGERFELTSEEQELLAACACRVVRGGGALAESLVARKILVRGFGVPPIPQPFEVVQREVDSWPTCAAKQRWQSTMAELDLRRKALERAVGLSEKQAASESLMEALKQTGINTRRDSQELYASRMPVNEDCRLAVKHLTLGQPVMEQIVNDALPWYELWRDLAGLYATRFHELLSGMAKAQGKQRIPFASFLPSMLQAWNQLSSVEDSIQRAWEEQLGNRSAEKSVQLTASDVSFLSRNFSFRRMKACDNVAPDFQIVAHSEDDLHDGRWTLLLAEIHPDFTLWQNCFFMWCPDAAAYGREYASEGGQGANVVLGPYPPHVGSTHTALWTYPLAHQWAFVGVCAPEGCQSVRPLDLLVEVTEDDVLLVHVDGHVLGSVLNSWTVALNTHRLEWRGKGRHSPRLYAGRVIVQRETWLLDFDETLQAAVQPGGYVAYTALREFRKKYGLPERVFVRGCLQERLTTEKDIKPVYIDFRNPLSVEMLSKMVTKFQQGTFSEMVPDIKDCWVRGVGGTHSSEFRTVLLASRESREREQEQQRVAN